MAADYPGSIKTFTTKTDKVDLVMAAHVNDIQAEVVAIETELGADVAGSATDLVTRLAISLADSGALAQGTSMPGTPVIGQPFYRTDEDIFYIYDGAAWDAIGMPTATAGDILYASAENTWSKLTKGTSGQFLKIGATIPAWAHLIAKGTYTGDGNATKAITGVGFQPTALIVWGRTGAAFDMGIKTSDDIGLSSAIVGAAISDDQIRSLDADGFTVGDGTDDANRLNINAESYNYIALNI